MSRFYLTTAIDYSNGDPHLGHALEKIGADCIARYRRLRGDHVHFLMGMDENSQSVIQMSERHAVTPQAWVDDMSDRFLRYWEQLGCSHDAWIRTTEPRHTHAVHELLRRIRDRNPADVYLADYEGLYCTGCEEFKTESQIAEGRCGEHPTLSLVPTREQNHFFRLSAYADRLRDMITSGALRVEPAIRRNEILRLIEMGLQDISISRSRLPWGIPFPGSDGHTIYVWFDAVINYLSATGFPNDEYESLWPADLHVVGKGITRFHCVLWPAMCLSAGIAPPRMVWAHGYVQWHGAKMSKTAGTAVTLQDAIARYGPDPLRYFLLREVGFEADGNFTWERYDERYAADLADGLGNLASRSLAMLVKYRDGIVPEGADTPLDESARAVVTRYCKAMDSHDLRGGADAAWSLVTSANQYIVQREPWALAKAGRTEDLDAVLAALARCLWRLAVLVSPYMPSKAMELRLALGYTDSVSTEDMKTISTPHLTSRRTQKPEVLFPKPDPVATHQTPK